VGFPIPPAQGLIHNTILMNALAGCFLVRPCFLHRPKDSMLPSASLPCMYVICTEDGETKFSNLASKAPIALLEPNRLAARLTVLLPLLGRSLLQSQSPASQHPLQNLNRLQRSRARVSDAPMPLPLSTSIVFLANGLASLFSVSGPHLSDPVNVGKERAPHFP
jgi:hypothetical protein